MEARSFRIFFFCLSASYALFSGFAMGQHAQLSEAEVEKCSP